MVTKVVIDDVKLDEVRLPHLLVIDERNRKLNQLVVGSNPTGPILFHASFSITETGQLLQHLHYAFGVADAAPVGCTQRLCQRP